MGKVTPKSTELDRKSKSSVTVYVITATQMPTLFGGQHIFIVLKQVINNEDHYFLMDTDDVNLSREDFYQSRAPCFEGAFFDIWKKRISLLETAGKYFTGEGLCCKKNRLTHITFAVAGDILEMADAWQAYRKKDAYDFFNNNCADMTEWFLEKYGHIPRSRACSLPVTCDRVGMGCWMPSFFQCGTLPGRVNENITYHLEKNGATNAPDVTPMGD